jgi:hypothetical protein
MTPALNIQMDVSRENMLPMKVVQKMNMFANIVVNMNVIFAGLYLILAPNIQMALLKGIIPHLNNLKN